MATRPRFLLSAGIGLLVGTLNGLLAVGGTLLIPSMVNLLKMRQHQAHGTSLWVILPTSAVSFTVYQTQHGIDWNIAGWIIAGGAVGGLLGAKFMKRLSPVWLKRLFAGFMLAAGIRMIIG